MRRRGGVRPVITVSPAGIVTHSPLSSPVNLPDEAEPLPVLEVSRVVTPPAPPATSGTEVVSPALVARQDGAGRGDADSPLPGSVGDISGDSAPLDSSVTGLGTLGPG